jgi:hypothetical protein
MARAYAIAGHKKRTLWALGLLLLGVVGCNMVRHRMFCLGCLHFYRSML